MIRNVFKKIKRKFVKVIMPNLPHYKGYPYLYARYYYWKKTKKCLSYSLPVNISEKLFWLNRYWQDPLVVKCSDKVAVREYVKECGLGFILNKFYATYDTASKIDFDVLPDTFVLKTNNNGASWFIVLCENKNKLDLEATRKMMHQALHISPPPGVLTADYQYQYIKPMIIAEEFISPFSDNKIEIQFFCFNGKVKHILVRNDLGKKAEKSFAISYNLNWERVKERIDEDLTIQVERPKHLDKMIEIAETLSKPFPHVRVDLYYADEKIIFGELTFTTSGKVLYNYTEEAQLQWGKDLKLPKKLKSKWSDNFIVYE